MGIKHAEKENARDLAQLINIAGEGIPEYLWRRMIVADESWLDDVPGVQQEKKVALAIPTPGYAWKTIQSWE